MIDNTAAQKCLHPGLTSSDTRHVIKIAGNHTALGCKVNGAGGDRVSMTILRGTSCRYKPAMIREIEPESHLYEAIPVSISRDGVQVWKTG